VTEVLIPAGLVVFDPPGTFPARGSRAVVVALLLHRPEHLARQWAAFRAQSYERKSLLVIENGPGVGACRAAGIIPSILLVGPEDIVELRNMALLEAVRSSDGDLLAFWDDDDWYGSEYLAEAAAALERSGDAAATKKDTFVVSPEGFWELTGICPGASHVAARTGGAKLVTDVKRAASFRHGDAGIVTGEDARWSDDMIRAGHRFAVTGRRNTVTERRGSDHASCPTMAGWWRAVVKEGGQVRFWRREPGGHYAQSVLMCADTAPAMTEARP
jgi:hypothetical protein